MSSSGILLRATVIAVILLLTGQGQPGVSLASGQDQWISRSAMPSVPRPSAPPAEAKVKQNLSYGNIPLYFVPNQGQVDEAARFYARASRYTLWLTAEGLVFDRSIGEDKPVDRTRVWGKERTLSRLEEQPVEGRREVHRLVFMGASPEPEIEGEGGTGHTANYFIGSDPSKWQTNIATSRAAVYKELYPNIDLKVYGVEKQIEYDWLVKPGGDPEAIDFAYQDVLATEIDAEGDLIIRTELGEFRHRKPDAFQERPDGPRESVQAHFRTIAPDRFGFTVESYDHNRALIIDPVVLIYSTYLGGDGWEPGRAIAVDGAGCAYITGRTASSDFPLRNAFQTINMYGTCYITKFSAAGNELIYSTLLGGGSGEYSNGIAVDGTGCAYVTGGTGSADFPTRNPFQAKLKGRNDVFVTKLAAGGNALVYSTYLGGNGTEDGYGIAVDPLGCAYVTGFTFSDDFPIRNAFQPIFKDQYENDAFVTKLSAAGNELVYSTFLGGSRWDSARGIAVDSSGCACVTGDTESVDFPLRNPFQGGYDGGWGECFVTKLAAGGNDLIFSTYLGGSDLDYGFDIFIDDSGCAYIAGSTYSFDFPLSNSFQDSLRGGSDAFIAKFTAAGDDLIYSTYFGGNGGERTSGIAADRSGCAYIIGETTSADLPLQHPFQATNSSYQDVFIAKFSAGGDWLLCSTYLGGTAIEYSGKIACDGSGCAYITGDTWSEDFPTRTPFQGTMAGHSDAFIVKLDMGYVVTGAVSGGGGTVSPATQAVFASESATVNIYPDSGYGIASITDNGGSVGIANPYVINNVQEDHAVVVTFDLVYTVTASVSGVGGSVNPPTQSVMAGGTASIDIYPDLGYHTGSIRDNGASVAIGSPYVINDVQEDHAVVVTFANAPPTIKIVNPTNGAKVYGVVTIKAEASDDLRVLKVAFLIDEQLIGEDAFAESTNIYAQAWDTRNYAYGTHIVKAVAYDEAGLTAEDQISVVVENVALTLQGQRLTESAWILKKPFIRLTIGIQNLGQVSVAKYVIYRKNGSGDFKAIKEISGNEVTGPSYVWDDKSINKNQTYTYRVLALNGNGVALGVSNDVTL